MHVLHDQVRDAVLGAHVVQHTNVRMVQRRDDAGFALKALLRFGIVGKMSWKNLDGNGTVKACVSRAINLSHAAGAERRFDFIGAEFSARVEGHPWASL